MTLNNWKMIAETRSYIFRWHSRFRRRRVCLSSLIRSGNENGNGNENATWKCTFWEWWLFCDHCFILTSFIVDWLRCKRTDRSAVNVNIENERFAVVCSHNQTIKPSNHQTYYGKMMPEFLNYASGVRTYAEKNDVDSVHTGAVY